MSARRSRQGVDAGMQIKAPRWSAFLAYSVHRCDLSAAASSSPAGSNPAADANGNITINPGDRLPGIPAHQVKLGGNYKVTDKWTVGANAIAQTGSYLFGDEANLTPQLPGYFTLNLSTTYQLTRTSSCSPGSRTSPTRGTTRTAHSRRPARCHSSQAPDATNPRAYSPAAPIGGFGGIRVTF